MQLTACGLCMQLLHKPNPTAAGKYSCGVLASTSSLDASTAARVTHLCLPFCCLRCCSKQGLGGWTAAPRCSVCLSVELLALCLCKDCTCIVCKSVLELQGSSISFNARFLLCATGRQPMVLCGVVQDLGQEHIRCCTDSLVKSRKQVWWQRCSDALAVIVLSYPPGLCEVTSLNTPSVRAVPDTSCTIQYSTFQPEFEFRCVSQQEHCCKACAPTLQQQARTLAHRKHCLTGQKPCTRFSSLYRSLCGDFSLKQPCLPLLASPGSGSSRMQQTKQTR
jgi:hypothetical protein